MEEGIPSHGEFLNTNQEATKMHIISQGETENCN